MYNDFVVVGPAADPAKIAGTALAREAFAAIAKAGAPFASRGDKSGTHTVELAIWADLGLTPGAPWYRSIGQGMGETLDGGQRDGRLHVVRPRVVAVGERQAPEPAPVRWRCAPLREP